MREAFGITNIYTLDNPIDCSGIVEKAYEYEPANIDPSFFHFVMVGRLSHEKGHIRALRAFSRLNNDTPCKLVIIGEGQERNSLESFVKSSNLEDSVYFTGHLSNPYPYIRCANAMIQPSFIESFGLTILEAMLLRIPVVTTDTIGGIRVTDKGKFGILVDYSEDGIFYGLENVLNNQNYSSERIESAYNWSLSFDLSQFKNKLIHLLEQ